MEVCGKRSWSLEGCDSNALILPDKKRNKKKGIDKDKLDKKQKLSKSQKRKLKKLEEDKDKALLLAKSVEILEKYKLPKDAFPLLQSSRDIGRAETMKEKRSEAVLASKAGLEVPDSDQPFERKCNDMADGETEAEMDNIHSSPDFDKDDLLQPIIQEREALKSASEIDKIPSRQDFKKDDSLYPMMPERDASKNASISLDSLQGAARSNEINGSGKVDEGQKVDYSRAINLQGFPVRRPLTAPM